MKNNKLFKLAVLNSLGVVIYVFLVSLILNNAGHIFGEVDNKLISPVVFLLLFVCSALLTGFLILGKPIMLYLDGDKKAGVKLLMLTGACLFILLLIFLGILIIV